MTPLYVTTGDSPQSLLEKMDADLTAHPLGPFDDEYIVVQSLGMERWVRQQLARRRGCAASLVMPFPSAFCRRLAATLQRDPRFSTGEPAGLDLRFEEPALIWRLLALLQDDALLADPTYAPLRTFAAGAAPTKRYGLARRLAGRFDEYRLYRPELVLAWETGQDGQTGSPHEPWQAALWRRMVAGETVPHFARWLTHTIARLESLDGAPMGLPTRVSVFGISTLPPLFVHLLQAVARFVPVRFYTLVPRGDAWQTTAPQHPLFDAFGQASRDLLRSLTAPAAGGVVPQVIHVASDPPHPAATASLLHCLQDDLRRGVVPTVPHDVADDDRSLSVHVCHAPMREMEVLRDQLLDAFAADVSLRPHDVLVMVPDVETYAPLAEAIFGRGPTTGPEKQHVIPYRVADRALAREAAPARALLQCLQLVTARLTASEVLELLLLPPVRRAAGIAGGQIDQVVNMVQQAGIRWGRDGTTRAEQFGLPAVEENSWRFGLDRLLAGYAAGRADALVSGVLPVGGDLVGDVALLGQLVAWVDALFERLDALRSPRPLQAWSTALLESFRWLVRAEGNEEQAASDRVTRALGDLVALVDTTGHEAAVDFEVVREWLTGTMGGDDHATGFLTGGMTICAMKPMRAIPHRVIAMLGLDDQAFPRRQRREAFDLIGASGRAGDRDPRHDDRQLVLDTLLCAGDRLLLSYVGRSQRDNAVIAPSIVVAELLDHLDAVATIRTATGTATPRARLRVEHPLQPFSPAYFSGDVARRPLLFSFDEALARSVRAAEARHDPPAFLDVVPAMPILVRDVRRAAEEPLVVTFDDLVETWVKPARYYCRRVLQLDITAAGAVLEDVEPMAVDGLRAFQVRQRMLETALQGRVDPTLERTLAVASGELPSGHLGPAWHDVLRRSLTPLLHTVGTPAFREPLTLDIAGPDWTVVGQLDFQLDNAQWRVRAASLNTADTVRAWVAHVARAAAGGHGDTRLVGMPNEERVFGPLADPLSVLDTLVQGVRAMRAAPLPYFIEAAAAYRDARARNRPLVEAARSAYEADGSFGSKRGDLLDPYVQLLWRGRDPFAEAWDAFVAVADAFWTPLEEATRP